MKDELIKINFLKKYKSLFFVTYAIDNFFYRINYIKKRLEEQKYNFKKEEQDSDFENDFIEILDNDDSFNIEVENINYIFFEISNNLEFYELLNKQLYILNISDNISINFSFNYQLKIIYNYQDIKSDYLVFDYINSIFILNINASIEKIKFNKELVNF